MATLLARVSSVDRILKLKKDMVISNTADLSFIRSESSQALASKIAALALGNGECYREPHYLVHLDRERAVLALDKKVALFAPAPLRESIAQTSIFKRGRQITTAFYGLAPSEQEIESAKQLAMDADVLIVCSYNAWKIPSQAALIHSLLDTGKPVIIVVVRDGLDAELFPKAHLMLKTFSPTAPSFQAVWDRLEAERKDYLTQFKCCGIGES